MKTKHVQFWTIAESEPSVNEDLEEGIGPYLLATIAGRQGYSTSVHQASQYGCNAQRITDQILAESPDILAFSIFSGGVRLLCEILSQTASLQPVIVGGPGATTNPDRVLSQIRTSAYRRKEIALVQSEGEDLFALLLQIPADQWETIGQAWRLDAQGKITQGQFGALRNLDEKPLIDLSASALRRKCEQVMGDGSSLLQHRIRAIHALQHCYVETRRGCFFKCEFCSEPTLTVRGVRKTSPRRAIQEVKHLFEDFGITFFNYADNIVFDDEPWWVEYAELLQALPYHHLIQFGGYGTPKFFSKRTWLSRTLPLLCDNGLSFVTMGVQSGSSRILKDIVHRQPDDPENALEVARQFVPRGLNVKTDFIVGHPTETIEDLEMTEHWIKCLYEAGAQIFVRRLGIVPESGYEYQLQANAYALPERTDVSEAIIKRMLWYHGRKDAYNKIVRDAGVHSNLSTIDRKEGTLFPRKSHGVDTLLANAGKVSFLPDPLRERFAKLFELVLQSKAVATA